MHSVGGVWNSQITKTTCERPSYLAARAKHLLERPRRFVTGRANAAPCLKKFPSFASGHILGIAFDASVAIKLKRLW